MSKIHFLLPCALETKNKIKLYVVLKTFTPVCSLIYLLNLKTTNLSPLLNLTLFDKHTIAKKVLNFIKRLHVNYAVQHSKYIVVVVSCFVWILLTIS